MPGVYRPSHCLPARIININYSIWIFVLKQVSLIRLALRLFSFRYTSVPSKILWKSCFGNCFFFPLIAESQLRKVREGKQPAYKIFPKQTFAQFFFLHKISVMRYQLLSGYFGLYPHSLSEKSGGEKALFLYKKRYLSRMDKYHHH